MKANSLHSLLIVILFAACAEKAREVTDYSTLKTARTKLVLEDPYAADPLTSENFKSTYSSFHTRKEPLQNIYTANQIDTIFHFEDGGDYLKFYQSASKQFLLAMNIQTKRIHLNREIKLGMLKKEFYSKFEALDSIKNKPDSVLIWMTTSRIDFVFRADTLNHIIWESEVE